MLRLLPGQKFPDDVFESLKGPAWSSAKVSFCASASG